MNQQLVLIVEDNDKNRKLVRDVLQFQGYCTVEAATGEEGIRLAGELRPDLIIMDVRLPGVDGLDALRRLRADAGTREIPVIACTASAMTDDREKIQQAGFDGYQPKPISVKGFLTDVRDLLARRRGAGRDGDGSSTNPPGR
jgi:two-component system, cell cycle response regulator DivK